VRVHRPQLVLATGEVLDEPLRALVRQTFGCELLDVYGSTELGYIACECPRHEGLHIFTWKVLVELLDETGREVPPGATGRVVVTDLFNEATPIIRYDGLGDYATRREQPCVCGRATPLLTRVEGRVVDSIVLPDGQIVHPYHLTLALEDVPGLSKFQIRQERPDYLRVLLVKDAAGQARGVSFAPDSALGRAILDRFDRILHHQARVELVTTEDIPRRPGSHKYATVVSLVKTD
jgi:phenylacetate-CoA ligase